MRNTDDILDQAIDEARSDETLSDIDTGYIKECIIQQIENPFENSSPKNYLKKIEEKISGLDVNDEYSKNICDNLYSDVIDAISEKMKFTVDKTGPRLDLLAKTFYKFFVTQYSENITMFIESCIIENQKTISAELANIDGINSRHIEGLNSKISLILNNISDVVEIINGMNLDFSDFLHYINQHEDANSSASKMQDYFHDLMNETDEIMPSIMNFLINEEEGFSIIYTDLQQNIYEHFYSN